MQVLVEIRSRCRALVMMTNFDQVSEDCISDTPPDIDRLITRANFFFNKRDVSQLCAIMEYTIILLVRADSKRR